MMRGDGFWLVVLFLLMVVLVASLVLLVCCLHFLMVLVLDMGSFLDGYSLYLFLVLVLFCPKLLVFYLRMYKGSNRVYIYSPRTDPTW